MIIILTFVEPIADVGGLFRLGFCLFLDKVSLAMQLWLYCNSLFSPGWLCLPGARIKSMSYHA